MRVRKSNIIGFLLPCLVLFLFVYLLPITIVFVTSFFKWQAGSSMNFAGISNYISAFKDARFLKSLTNTLIWVVLQCTIHVTIGTVLAFILSRKFKGWKLFRTVSMLPNVISSAALGIIFLNLFNPQMGIINTIISKITNKPFQWNWYFSDSTSFITVTLSWVLYAGLITTIMLASIQAVPLEIFEAAKVDGASQWQIDTQITLPMVRTSLGTCVIIAGTSMLKEFELIFLTTNGGPGISTLNLPLYIYKTALTENNYGYANMMGVILIITGIIFIYIINRTFHMDQTDM